MKTRSATVALLVVLLAGNAIAEPYDFFQTMRYPEGGKLREGVALYKVKEGGGKPQEYARRVVEWWPRKGVDVVEGTEGMPLREWTLKPDMFDSDRAPKPELDWEVFEHDKLDMPAQVGEHYVRHLEGYLHPPADGLYTFKIAADDNGSFFLSTDDSRKNVKLVCYSFAYSHRYQFHWRAGQISKPIPLKKGRKYYYEAMQREGHAHDNLMIVWKTATMDQEVPSGEAISTLDGRVGKVVERRASLEGVDVPTTEVRPPGQPRRFKAHLIGFDGMGNDLGDPTKEEDLREPGVVLRMPDGRRQIFARGSFCRKDREYIYRLYRKEMARIKATLDKTVYTVKPGTRKKFPGGTPAGEPGSWLKQSDHFVVPSGSQGTSWWLGLEDPEAAARRRALVFSSYENMYAVYEYCGHLMPYWDRQEKYKYEGRVGGTILNGYEKVGSGPGGGYGGQGLIPGETPGGGFAHEYGHGFANQWNSHFSGEIIAQHMMSVVDGNTRASGFNNSISRPWRSALHASYDTTLFFRALGSDPNWGSLVVAAIPKGDDEKSFFQTLARVGQQRGLFKDGIRGLGDTVGDYGARMAEFDWPFQHYARGHWFSARRNYLEPVDRDRGVYRIPWDEAPEPFGVNIIRLVPEEGSDAVTVDFQGYHDPATYSDWRACIVAVDSDGQCRYTDLWNKGVMRMERRPGDRRYWLTVAATPSALLTQGLGPGWASSLSKAYSGHYAVRYPWQVTLEGAVPGAPQRTRLDLDDVYGIYGHLWIGGFLPVVPSTAKARHFLERAKAFLKKADKTLPTASFFERMSYYANTRFTRDALSDPRGAKHPNGGGWVSATAEAAPTAYLGPNVRVLGNARVLDHAIIEDYAVISDNAVMSGHARVGGQAFIGGHTKLGGYQRAWMPLSVEKGEETPDLTARKGQPDGHGLWANYAMDQPEACMLEDYYRSRDRCGMRFSPVYNGYLYGRPVYVTDGEHSGFRFDGKTQYAELNRHITDVGEITLDMTVKWKSRGEQVLLDCGNGAENHFMLVTAGPDNKPVFTATVDGKRVAELTAKEALKKNAWTRVRLEIDGEKIAIWMDDKRVAEKKSGFRPADVFKPGNPQRSFLAAGLDGRNKFKGVFDKVVVYHKVHGEAFADVPAPIRDAPRRPAENFTLETYRDMKLSPYAQNTLQEEYEEEAMKVWEGRAARGLIHLTRLKLSVPEYVQAVEKAKELEQWEKDTRERLRKRYYAQEDVAALVAEKERIEARRKEVDARIRAIEKERSNHKPKQKETHDGEEKARKRMSGKARKIQNEIRDLEAKVAELEAVERRVRDAVAAMPQSKAAAEEIDRLKKEIGPLRGPAHEKLKEARAGDETLKKIKLAAEHLKYAQEYWRVRRACRVVAKTDWREAAIEKELIARDPQYRTYARIGDRIEELERDQMFRLSDYALKHTDYPLLFGRGGDRNRSRLEQVRDQLRRTKQDLEREMAREGSAHAKAGDKTDSALEELHAERQSLDGQKRALEKKLHEDEQAYVDEKIIEAGLNEKTTENIDRLKAATKVVRETYPLEYTVLCSFIRQNFHGFYNTRMASSVRGHARRLVGGRIRDDLREVKRMEETYAPQNWKTTIDQWDGRTVWEVEGELEKLPLTKKWLKRVGQGK